ITSPVLKVPLESTSMKASRLVSSNVLFVPETSMPSRYVAWLTAADPSTRAAIARQRVTPFFKLNILNSSPFDDSKSFCIGHTQRRCHHFKSLFSLDFYK